MEKIIIAGAGYAGVIAAREMLKNDQPATLINAEPYHQLTTWLHEAAGGRNQVDDYKIDLRDLFPDPIIQLVVDEITGIDWKKRRLTGSYGVYPYDYALIALGSTPEYFNIEGLYAHSLPLKSLESARVIRRHIEREFMRYGEDHDEIHLRVIVGGAGLTGVEFVGELAEWLPDLCHSLKIEDSKVEIICVEAMPDILPMLPNHLRDWAQHELEAAGVQFMTSSKIVRVEKQTLELAGGEKINAGTIVWTGGVRAHPLLGDAGFTCDRKGRAKVKETLQSVDDDRVWIAGDCASYDWAGKPLPPTAQLATQMGKQAALNIIHTMQKEEQHSFTPKIYGTLASLGPSRGVGAMVGIRTSGRFASLFKELTKVKYLMQIGGVRMVNRKRRAHLLQV